MVVRVENFGNEVMRFEVAEVDGAGVEGVEGVEVEGVEILVCLSE